jgi:hypothetical protein
MRLNALLLIAALSLPINAKILLVPQSYPTLQSAIYAARCNDTVLANSVPDKVKISFYNKVLWIIGSPKGDSLQVTMPVSITINESKCFIKNFKVLGSKGANQIKGGAAVYSIKSQVEVDSCTFVGGEGGANPNCGRYQGGPGISLSTSKIRIANSSCLGGSWGSQGGSCICFNCPPLVYHGTYLNDSSILEKNNLSGDSIIIDSTSSITQNSPSFNYDCFVYGSDTAAFSIFPYQIFLGATGGTVSCYDYNNDNSMDFFVDCVSENITYLGHYINKGDWNFSTSEGGPGSVRGGNFVSLGDADNDGDVDYIKTHGISKNVTIGDSGGSFFTRYGESSINFGDYDNDGRLEILEMPPSSSDTALCLLWDNAKPWYIRNSQKLLPLGAQGAAWGDYDMDFDNDLLIHGTGLLKDSSGIRLYQNEQAKFVLRDSLDGSQKYGSSNCKLFDMNNDGKLEALIDNSVYLIKNHHFERTQTTLPNGWTLGNIGDIDNDGDLDIICPDKIYLNNGETWIEKRLVKEHTMLSGCDIADLDNDGDLDIVVMGFPGTQPENGTRIYINNSKVKNVPPAPPSSLKTSVNGNEVLFNWSMGVDDHTPKQSLSYSLRVGKTPLGCQIMSPASDPKTGYHFIPQMGNVCLDTGWILRNLPEGTYYWSVQTIDNSWLGSSFAPEQSFAIGPTGVEKPCPVKNEKKCLVKNGKILIAGPILPGSNLTISLFDIKGRSVYQQHNKISGEMVFSLEEFLPPGIYIYRIELANSGKEYNSLFCGKVRLL